MPFEIRAMTIGDYAEVYSLWQCAEGLVLGEADTGEAIAKYLERNPDISHVAVNDGRIIGAALCGHDGRRGFLHHLAVAPAFRKQGIGRAIVDACQRALQREGISRCNIFVLAGHDAAQLFWRHNGWYEWNNIRLMSSDWSGGETDVRT
jgi:ribosomal protein S18 acetylase RimI-like enzyme